MTDMTEEAKMEETKDAAFEPGIEYAPVEAYKASQIRVYRAPKNTVRMTVGDERSYIRVRPVQASPVAYPNRYIALLDIKNEEVAFIEDMNDLDEVSKQVIEEELTRRYLKAQVEKINAIQMEYGVSYWDVVTDRGPREFVIRGHENTYWASDIRLLLTDVDGNRFEIIDYTKLDPASVKLIETNV